MTFCFNRLKYYPTLFRLIFELFFLHPQSSLYSIFLPQLIEERNQYLKNERLKPIEPTIGEWAIVEQPEEPLAGAAACPIAVATAAGPSESGSWPRRSLVRRCNSWTGRSAESAVAPRSGAPTASCNLPAAVAAKAALPVDQPAADEPERWPEFRRWPPASAVGPATSAKFIILKSSAVSAAWDEATIGGSRRTWNHWWWSHWHGWSRRLPSKLEQPPAGTRSGRFR